MEDLAKRFVNKEAAIGSAVKKRTSNSLVDRFNLHIVLLLKSRCGICPFGRIAASEGVDVKAGNKINSQYVHHWHHSLSSFIPPRTAQRPAHETQDKKLLRSWGNNNPEVASLGVSCLLGNWRNQCNISDRVEAKALSRIHITWE